MIFRILVATVLLVGLLPVYHPAKAYEEPLPGPIAAILEKAALRNEGAGFIDAVLLLMDAQPDIARTIYHQAVLIAPALADELKVSAAGEFPDLALSSEIVTAVAQVATGEETSPGGFFNLAAWKGELDLGGSISTGNSDEEAIAIGFGVESAFSEIWDHALNVHFDFARRTGVTTKQRFLADYQLYYRQWARAYAFTFLQYDDDRFSGFDYRLLESVGAGYTLFDSEKQQWNIEGGPGVRQSKIAGQALRTEFVGVFSSTYRYIFNENVSVGDAVKVFIGTDRTTIENTADLVARLNSALSAKLSFGVKYDSNVPAGSVKTDTITRASIVYGF